MSIEGQGPDFSPSSCPGCDAEVPDQAVICVNCGYHLREGRYLTTAVERADLRKTIPESGEQESTLPQPVIRKAEAITRDADLVWVVMLLFFCTCGIAAFFMLPWYIWRWAAWTRLNDAHEELRNSLSAHGDLAVRFQRAWGKLVIGICIGALLWIGLGVNGYRKIYLNPPYLVNVDPARHQGPDRLKLEPYDISLIRPDTFQVATSTTDELLLEGPVWPMGNQGIPARINLSAVKFPTPKLIEQIPQRLVWERIGAIPAEFEVLDQGHTTIDEKAGYYVKMRKDISAPNTAAHLRKYVTITEYHVIGYNYLYTMTFVSAQDALAENQPAFDLALESIHVD